MLSLNTKIIACWTRIKRRITETPNSLQVFGVRSLSHDDCKQRGILIEIPELWRLNGSDSCLVTVNFHSVNFSKKFGFQMEVKQNCTSVHLWDAC